MATTLHEWDSTVAKVQWALIRAHIAYWSWQIVTKPVLGLIYFSVIAEGLRFVVPPLGQRLYKLPGLAWLYGYEDTHRLDLANLFSIFLLIAVWHLWGKIIELWLGFDWGFGAGAQHSEDHHKFLVVVLGTIILAADSLLFYVAMVQLIWGGSLFSLSAILATAAYLGVLIFVTYSSVILHAGIIELKRED
jgi:hypothetical protein